MFIPATFAVIRLRSADHCKSLSDYTPGSLAELEAAVEAAVANGGVPFFVGATSGSTVLGAFDPLVDLAKASARAETSKYCRPCVMLIY